VKRLILPKTCRFIVPPAVALMNYINEKWYNLADFFPKLEFSPGFLYILLISPEGTSKL
jgi:hypothetical protein